MPAILHLTTGQVYLVNWTGLVTGGSLTLSGNLTVNGQIIGGTTDRVELADGTATAPSLTFASDLTKGLYSPFAGAIAFVSNAANPQILFSADTARGVEAAGNTPFSWSSSLTSATSASDTFLYRDGAASTIVQRNGTNAQRFSVANTFTSSISREDFSVDWQTTSNTAIVGTRTAATGTNRTMMLSVQGANAANAYSGFKLAAGLPIITAGYFNSGGTQLTDPTAGTWFSNGIVTSSATSGQVNIFAITPTYNQASGNAANTDLLINRTETLVGSGTQLFLDCQVGGSSKFAINHFGTFTQYAGTAVQGFGMAAIRAVGRSTAQAAAVASVATIASVGAADGTFEVSANVLITASTTFSFTVSCAYTDEGNTARSLNLIFYTAAVSTPAATIANTGGAVPYHGLTTHIRAKAGTSITISTVGTFTTVTYNVEGIIRQLA